MLKRKAEAAINNWILESKTALLVSGARQVGKTYTIRNCLSKAKRDYIEINLIEQPELIPVLECTQSVDDLVINLSAATNHSFIKGETIIFIDEVQEVRDIVTRIKFWVDDGRFKYILSGSLLGIELQGLRSAPVGYLEEIQMFPMDFGEFIISSGVQQDVIDYLRECYEKQQVVSELIHDKMLQHFRRYLVVGGMPAAVQEYVGSGDISKVNRIQENILKLYKKDFTKYEDIDRRLMLIEIFDVIPSQLLKHNLRFNYSDIKKGLRYERMVNSFVWLVSAGVAIATYNTSEPRIALSQNSKNSLLKLYSSDVGLLTSQYGNALRTKILIGDSKVNLGGVYENAVAQELNAHGFKSYFYNRHGIGELDFLIEEDAAVIPIEVKSGKDYYVHSALSKVIENKEYEIKKGYVLSNYNVSTQGRIIYLPIYMSMFINDNVALPILKPIE